MQPKVFKEAFLENKKHFEVLIVSESLLCEIAKMCVQNSETKDQCLQELEKLITSNISCDVLVLQMQDKPYKVGFSESYLFYGFIYKPCMPIPPSEALPLEVIDRMITKWKVKSLKLQFLYTNRAPVFSKVWSEKKFFTEIYMDKEIETVRLLEHHLENVDIDLSDSLMSPFPVEKYGFQNEHLVGNIRKLFLSKKYSIVTKIAIACDFRKVEEYITSLLKAVWIDGSKNIELSIRHVAWFPDASIERARVPSSFRGRPLRHVSYPVPTKIVRKNSFLRIGFDYYGRRFELEDESTQCKLKAEVLISYRSSGFSLDIFEHMYSSDIRPFGQGDPNSLCPLVYDVCGRNMEDMLFKSRSCGRIVFQGPLNGYRKREI